jgi:hypothetical protein
VARFSEQDRKTIWDMREAGVPVKRIARHLGRLVLRKRRGLPHSLPWNLVASGFLARHPATLS